MSIDVKGRRAKEDLVVFLLQIEGPPLPLQEALEPCTKIHQNTDSWIFFDCKHFMI